MYGLRSIFGNEQLKVLLRAEFGQCQYLAISRVTKIWSGQVEAGWIHALQNGN